MIKLNAIALGKENLTSCGDEKVPRMSFEESRKIRHSRRILFGEIRDGKVEIWTGEYYAVLTNESGDAGVIISTRQSDRLAYADERLLIGRVCENSGPAAYFPKIT